MNVSCRLRSACLVQRSKATSRWFPHAISSLRQRHVVPPYYPSPSIIRFFASSDTNNMSDVHSQQEPATTTANPPPFDIHSIKGEFGSYAEDYKRSLQDPEAFWGEAAKAIHWFQEPSTILQTTTAPPDPNNPLLGSSSKWFPDGKLNISYNCLDVHVQAGRGDQDALIYDSPVTHKKERYTYRQLLHQVELFSGVLQEQCNVQIGDRVVLYMPMIPQAVIAMLACTRIGAIHSVVFGGFAAQELATRITDCQPKVIVSASAGVEGPTKVVPYQPLLQRALKLTTHTVNHTIMVQRPDLVEPNNNNNDCSYLDYDNLMAKAKRVDAVPVASDHPHYVLYTSGTTGLPKGVVRDTGGSTVALKYSMDHFYNMNPGDVFWAASDIGWVVGHSYIVYAPLLHGCTAILYEGKPVGTPDAGAFWRVLQEYQVKALFVAPTAFRAMKQADPQADLAKKYDLSSVETIFLAGEHSDPETMHWIERATPGLPPPIDHWWQTELGWYVCSCWCLFYCPICSLCCFCILIFLLLLTCIYLYYYLSLGLR
jgi:propionyl-CoA synthetase